MTKLTEMIKIKDTVVGAGILTALSGFVAFPAQAFTFSWGGSPRFFTYEVTLNTDPTGELNSEGVVFDNAIEQIKLSDDVGNFIIERNSLDLHVQISSLEADDIPTFEGNFLVPDTPIEETIFEYSIDLGITDNYTRDNPNSDNGEPQQELEVDYDTLSLVIPSSFIVGGETISLFNEPPILSEEQKLLNSLQALGNIANIGDITVPYRADFTVIDVADRNPPLFQLDDELDDNNGITISSSATTPESSTTITILGLGIFGLGAGLRRKIKTKSSNY